MSTDSPTTRHLAPNVFDRSTLIEDAVTFYLNNKIYEGWKNVSVTKRIDSVAGVFQITLHQKFSIDRTDWEFKPGERAHMHLGKNAIFEGYIDTMNVSFGANSRNLTISGRDKTADLVDCSVLDTYEFTKPLIFTEVATKICSPFGIKVLAQTDVGDPFNEVSVKPGEKAYALLSRLASQRGLLLYSSTHGNLIINKRGAVRASTELVEGVNILEASMSSDNSERFSQYVVKGQNNGLIGSKPEDATEAEGSATDSGIFRYRPYVLISESSADNKASKERAEWEATYRSAKSLTISVKVPEWRQRDGSLWGVNQLVYLDSPSLGLKSQFLVNAVSFSLSPETSRETTLELVRKDAYERVREVSASNDPLAGLGY